MARSVPTAGQNRYLRGTFSGTISAANGATVVAWIKPASASSRTHIEFRRNSTGGTDGQLSIKQNTSSQFFVRASTGATANQIDATCTTAFTTGEWYHVAGWVSGSTTSTRIFLNGVQEANNTLTARRPSDLALIGVGSAALNTTNGALQGDGSYGEVAFYDVALTTAEIKALASGVSPLRIRPQNLVVYYPLSGGTDSANRDEASVAGVERVVLTPQSSNTVTVVSHPPVEAPTLGRRRIWVPYIIQGGGGAEVITGTDPDALTLATAQGTVHVGAVVTGTAPAALALSGVQGQATQGQQVTGAPDDLTLATVAGQVFVGSVVEGATEALTLQTYQGAVEEIPDVPTVDGVTETLALSTAQGAVEVGALVEGQVEALTLTTAPGEALAGVFLDGSSEALSLQTQPGQALTGVAVEGQTEALTLQTYPGTIDLENPVIVTGVTESLTLATNPGAATPGALVEGQTEALALTTYRGTVGTVIAARFGGGFYTRKHRKIPRTADDREELRALLTEAFDGPAQEPVKALLRAAEPELGVSPRSWAKPSTKALDALMGRAEVIQQVLTLIWEAEEREEAQRRDEEHLLLLMVL